MLKNTMDPQTISSRLSEWLSDTLEGNPPVEVTDVDVSASNGMSCESVLLTAKVGSGADAIERGLVARVAPETEGIFYGYDLAREGRVMDALARGTDLPVPAMVGFEGDTSVLGAPFLVVERHYGRVPSDDPPYTAAGWVLELSDDQRATMFDNMLGIYAGMGATDPKALGLDDLAREGDGSLLQREVAYWEDFYWRAADGHTYPTQEATLEWIKANVPADDTDVAVSWGDARFGNVMFGDDLRVTGILDWEMATIGSPMLDFGFFLFVNQVFTTGMGVPVPSGFYDRERAIARYEELSGKEVRDVTFYEAFAGLRSTMLMMRVGRLMISMGMMPEDHPMPSNNPGALTLPLIIDVPAPEGGAGWITGSR
jgi:aminoglycoside phosphotransferase (APT) family kinase protein